MGVNQLWNILEPVRKKENLSALRNKTLCVDLSCWICEARCAKGLNQNVSKPHLRNLFFRLLHLTRLGVKLVFVVDGEPPELKWEAITKRIQLRNGGQKWRSKNSYKTGSGARVGRSHFAVWVRECCNLLNLLGIPFVESTGEAEALCAWLDLHQIVDGCITNDGDAFLYGARTVYKDLCISGKDASVECYKMEEIESRLNLNRQKLVALAILLGCDYLPQGVSGVGKENAMKLIRNVNHDDLIDRFYEWTKGTCRDEDLSSVEKSVKCKALKDKNFPHHKVIQEFLAPNVVPQQVSLKIVNPDLQGLQEFCLKNLDWPEDYTRDKVLLLVTYWQMTSSLQHRTATLVEPKRIVKARVQQKVECYEVEWQNVELGETCPATFVTVETREIFNQVYPDLVEEFNNVEEAKLLKKPKKKKACKESKSDGSETEMDLLSQQLKDLSVCQPSEPCQLSEVQNEKPLAGKICEDKSLQDIIDSILPSSIDHQSNSEESFSPSTRMNDAYGNFLAAGSTLRSIGSDNCCDGDDDDDKHDCGNNDDDWDDTPFDFMPLKMGGMAATESHHQESDFNEEDSEKQAKVNQVMLDCCDDYESYDKRFNIDNNKRLASHRAQTREKKPISIVIDSSDDDDDESNGFGDAPVLKQSLETPNAKAPLNDVDVSAIFGSSDLWSSDNDDEGATSGYGHGKTSFIMNPSSITKVNTARHVQTAKCLDCSSANFSKKSMMDVNQGLSCDTGVVCSTTPEFEENSERNVIKHHLTNVSSTKLNILSCKDDGNISKEPSRETNHKDPCKSFVLQSRNNSQKITQCEGVNNVHTVESSEIQQQQESCKENVNSPFDDYMPAPLFKRLGKNFSGKHRLASLRSISTTIDDI